MRLLFVITVVLALSSSTAIDAQNNDFARARYGVVQSGFFDPLAVPTRDLGVGSVRFDAGWKNIQLTPPPNPYDWSTLVQNLNNTVGLNPQLDVLISIDGPMPGWAAPCGTCAPYRYSDYGVFFEAVIRRTYDWYAEHKLTPDVVFGVWNEPNLSEFLDPNPDVYHRLFIEASAARDRVNWGQRIGGPETSHHAQITGYFSDIMGRIGPYLRSSDILTVHWYSDAPWTVIDYMDGMSSAAGARQAWLTEAGPRREQTCNDEVYREGNASIIDHMQVQRLNWWRTFIYRMWGNAEEWADGCEHALLYLDHSPRPAYVHYQTDIAVVMSKYSLAPTERLAPDQGVTSPNGRFALYYQGDGNLVLYRIDVTPWQALWASCTQTTPGFTAMQTDGNLVVYRGGEGGSAWATNTNTYPGSFLSVRDDGLAVIYRGNGGDILWQSTTWCV